MRSPDHHAWGFLQQAPKSSRYESVSDDPGNVASKLAALIPPKSSILDVGCGTGSVSEIVKEMTGSRLLGLEPDAERAELARKRGLNVVDGVLSEAFLQDREPFDIIMFADVLEHLSSPAEAIDIARLGLVPGGSIVASVPNVAHWFVRTDIIRGRFDYQDSGIMDATHLRWFTQRSLRQFFERLGFTITALDCTVSVELADYGRRMPWRWLSLSNRRRAVGFLAQRYPTLFGCQHVIRATCSEGQAVARDSR